MSGCRLGQRGADPIVMAPMYLMRQVELTWTYKMGWCNSYMGVPNIMAVEASNQAGWMYDEVMTDL